MKKLNRKGFTLVELLAVIIILAIVVGITIPAVLTTTNKAKQKAFQTAADTAADWFDRQYQVALTGLDGTGIATLDENYENACTSSTTGYTNCTDAFRTFTINSVSTDADGNTTTSAGTHNYIASAAGLKTSNIQQIQVKINASTGRSCVILTALANGDYDDAGQTVTVSGTTVTKSGNLGSGDFIASSGC